MDFELDEGDADDGEGGQEGGDPPEDVDAYCDAVGAAVLQGDHLDDRGVGDDDAREAGGLDEVMAQFIADFSWVSDEAQDVQEERHGEKHDGINPDDLG